MVSYYRHIILVIAAVAIIITGCESPTVSPDTILTGTTPSDPGSTAMTAFLSSPANGGSNVSESASIVIVFSYPVNAADVTSNLSLSGSSSGAIAFTPTVSDTVVTIDPTPLFQAGETITVNLGPGIYDSTSTYPIDQDYPAWTFGVVSATVVDNIAPTVITDTQNPANGDPGAGNGTVSINISTVSITFNESMNSATVIAGMSISPVVAGSTVTQVGTSNTYQINLGSPLNYDTLYTVSLAATIEDASGNTLGATSWVFRTVPSSGTLPGSPAITGHYVSSITNNAGADDNDVTVSFNTDEPTTNAGSSISYGTDTTYADGSVTESGATSTNIHSITLSTLADNTRYYYQITSDTATATGSFYTPAGDNIATDNPGTGLKDDGGNNSSFSAIQVTDSTGGEDGSAIMVYLNDSAGDIYGSFFATNGTDTWSAGSGEAADSLSNKSNPRVFSDQRGYALMTVETGGTIYMKRIYNNGGAMGFHSDWISNATGSNGITVGTGTNPSAAITWGGAADNNIHSGEISSPVTSGTATIPATINPFYDFSADFNSSVTTGDHVIDGSYNGADLTTTTFRHVLDQDSSAVTSGETYYIGSNTNSASGTGADHDILTSGTGITSYANSNTLLVTDHSANAGFTAALAITIDANDLVYNSITTDWGLVTGGNTTVAIDALTPFTTGTTDGTTINRLVDSTNMALGGTQNYDLVANTTDGTYSYRTGIGFGYLDLNDDIFVTGKSYTVYTGVHCYTHPTADDTTDFTTIPVSASANPLVNNIGDGFTIYNGLLTGTADTPPSNPLYADADTFSTDGVTSNNLVYNTTDQTWAKVTEASFTITERALDLDSSIFANGETYEIYSMTDHTQTTNIIVSSAADATSAGELSDSTVDFNGLGVTKGDVVYNITDDLFTVATATPASGAGVALELSMDIFDSGDNYLIFTSSQDIHGTGVATSTTANALDDTSTGNDFTSYVTVGDIVKNITTSNSAKVTAVAATQLTLSSDIMTSGQTYIIIQPRILAAYESSSNDVAGRLFNLNDGSAAGAEFDIDTTGTSTSINVNPMHNGYVFVSYLNSTGLIRGKVLDYEGSFIIGTNGTTAGTTLSGAGVTEFTKAVSWNNGSNSYLYILYSDGSNYYIQRKTENLAASWSATLTGATGADISLDAAGNVLTAYVDPSGDIVTSRLAESTGVETVLYTMPLGSSSIAATIVSLKVLADGNGGAFTAWADDRYFSTTGFVVFTQHFDSAGTPQWDAASGGGSTDYNGLQRGIITTTLSNEVNIEILYYDDGGVPNGVHFLWYDYRNSRSDIYHHTMAN